MSEIPEDVMKTATETWHAALRDGTPDAALIIARAIMAERERGAQICRERLPLYTDIGQKNAVKECINSIRNAQP